MSYVIEKISAGLLMILSWFNNPELITPIDEGVEIECKPKKEKNSFPETLTELLDNLGETFDSYKIPTHTASWISSDSRIGLKKLGAHVPNHWDIEWIKNSNEIKVDISQGFPSMFLISMPFNKFKADDSIYPCFMFAIKHRSLPWNVEKKDGVPYQFGFSYRDNKLFWMTAWLVVQEDGTLKICKEHRNKNINILSKGKHIGSYTKKVFDTPELVNGYVEEGKKGEEIVLNSFLYSFNWWINRKEKWSVAVKKRGDRVTFSVDKELTKKYFADRDKTIKTPSGRNKKIIHFVKAHDRNANGKISKVKEHIRGLNKFNWKGYECLVTAPEFQGLVTSQFDIAPAMETDGTEVPEGYKSLSYVGLLLAKKEEQMSIR